MSFMTRPSMASGPRKAPSRRHLPPTPSTPSTPSILIMDDDDDDDTADADSAVRRRHPDSILSFLALHFDEASLAGLDDALLLAPADSFADLCYAECMCDDADAALLSWRRRVSQLLPARAGAGSDSESSEDDEELATPTDAARWQRRHAKSPKRVAFAPLPDVDAAKSGVSLPLGAPAFCDAEATMAFLLSSLPADPQHSVHYFPTLAERRPPPTRKGSLSSLSSVVRGLAGLRPGWAR